MRARIIVLVCFVLLLAVPFVFRPSREPPPPDALRLIIISPHNEQIRTEFGRAFDDWHAEKYGQRVNVVWNVPGGTSEIRKMLHAQYKAAIEAGEEPGGDADLVFGGGSYEHDSKLKRGVLVNVRKVCAEEITRIAREVDERRLDPTQRQEQREQRIVAMLTDIYGDRLRDGTYVYENVSAPVDFDDDWLASVYGPNDIGGIHLYDPDRHWFGTALSGFGIVYNRHVLRQIDVDEPMFWADLCSPKLRGWVALVNPGQSGSITTAFEAILHRRGWPLGWQILRRAAANARYFSASSLKPPTDVSQGNAAMGVCIDFYGRYQSQAIKEAGDPDRLGYVDPPGVSTIDPDPISMLRGAPAPGLAKRFIAFCLSPEGQSLWQFRADDPVDDGLGPRKFELRRMPIRRSMYDRFFDRMIDRVNPFELASPLENPNRDVRAFIAVLFAAMAMDSHDLLQAAWEAIVTHPAYPQREGIVLADHVQDPVLAEMLRLFDAMPAVDGPDGTVYPMAEDEHLATINDGWLRGGWQSANLWHPDAAPQDVMRIRLAASFREQYRQILRLAGRDDPLAPADN